MHWVLERNDDGLQNPLHKDIPTKLRDEEIQERVKIPVDERLGGCRGFKSHRPHQSDLFRDRMKILRV